MEWGKKEYRRAKQVELGLREKIKAGEPVDFVLIPPIYDNRFWYHDLIGQIADC